MAPITIPHHQLGKNGPMIPAMGFGLMGMSHSYGAIPSDEERFVLLDRAVELGATFWDSSDLYGDNEELLGKWFRRTGKREEIFLATKFSYVKGGKPLEVDSSGAYCKRACAESLRQLGVDYYLHSANPKTPIEETMRALADLQAEGKIKHIGLSNVSSTTLRRAYKIAPVAAVQAEYSLFTRDAEGPAGTNLLTTCRELGVAVVANSPLGRGLITQNFRNGETITDTQDVRSRFMPRFQGDNRERNIQILQGFTALAEKKDCTVSQLALAWLLKQGDGVFPIPGTKKLRYLEENWGALGISLTDNEEKEIRAFAEMNEMAGPQIPAMFADHLFRDTVEES
ncbi:hypothetical protein FE257_000158 [Aspergillus nanangensis]|uniref:NADP-dependent oxidoreductase domain-containing protein n=1 Tax=Aspergillus nanangensis TaxID=2582783 RepID=A0AAD4GZS1_ASPNN|nr:hypothetical protein FE257_000158 [Aspergillus nanangensis]